MFSSLLLSLLQILILQTAFHLLLRIYLLCMRLITIRTELAFYWNGVHRCSKQFYSCAILCSFLLISVVICRGVATEPGSGWTQMATLDGDASWWFQREIPKTYLDSSLTQDLASSVSSQFSPPISAFLATEDLMLLYTSDVWALEIGVPVQHTSYSTPEI